MTTNDTFSNRKLVLAYPSEFMIQSAFDVAIANADIDGRHPMATPAFHGIIPFREEFRDCGGEYVVIEKITGKIARFTIGFDATALLLAGWFAYLQGTAAAPTGTPEQESQTLSLGGGTGGTAQLSLDFEGSNSTSPPFAVGVGTTAAQVQAAIDAMRSVNPGNILVTGAAGGPFTLDFSVGYFENANIPTLTVTDASTGGGGVTITPGTNGANKLHLITRNDAEKPVKFSLIEGFEGDTGGTKKYRNLVVDSWSAQITRRGKCVLTVVAYGSAYPEGLSGYTMPVCENFDPILASETRIKIGANWIASDLREMTYTESNNIDVSEDALIWDASDVDELERGDRTSLLNVTMLGSPTSDLYEFAEDENEAFDSFQLALGRPGERLSIFAPNAQFRLDDSLIEFVGNKNKSAFQLIARPSPEDITGIVTRGEYVGDATFTFLED